MPLSTRTSTYAADEIILALAGIAITGFGKSDFVEVEFESDDFSDEAGADGEVTRSRSNDRRATVTITLMQSSLANDQLTALRLLAINGTNGADIGTFVLKDNGGTTIVRDDHAWIMRFPNVGFGKDVKEREWKIRLAHADATAGGNPSVL